MSEERGAIRNRQHAAQLRDFTGIRFGNITPTDIDMMIEYKNICYVYAEFKYENATLPYGQRLALERQCDDMSRVKPTIGIIASHNSPGDIDAANTVVTEFRFRGAWHETQTETTTMELVSRFVSWAEFARDTN